jgi:hypothetical protein
VCELQRVDQITDELLATLPEGFSQWSMQHLASIMLEDSAWPQEFRPARLIMGWGRAWRQGVDDDRITRISGFQFEGPSFSDQWGRCLVVCTRQGAIARSHSLAHRMLSHLDVPRPRMDVSGVGEGLPRRRLTSRCFVPLASNLASAVDAALDSAVVDEC